MAAASHTRYALRVALAYGETIVREAMVDQGGVITVGQSDRCTFVLPIAPLTRKWLRKSGVEPLIAAGELHLLPDLDGRLSLGGAWTDLATLRAAGKHTVRLAREDWGVLHLRAQPRVRLIVLHVPPEARPQLSRDTSSRPLFASTALAFVAMALLLGISFLRYDPNRPQLTMDDVDERFARAMFNRPPEEPPEEEPEVGPEDQEEEKSRKRAGGEEGKFGDPNKTGPSNVPRNAFEVPTTQGTNVGVVKEMNLLAQKGTVGELLGLQGQISGLDSGELVMGGGNYGMSTRGGGGGGGGEGEGMIHGTGDVDVGGGGSDDRKKTVKGSSAPKEKGVSVAPGTATVKGQLSKELIDKEVRRHKAQISFCYTKQLTRFPNLQGKVLLQWIISLDGSVKGAKVKSSSLGNSDVESCMVRALQGWRFPKPEGGVVEVVYPFILDTK